MKLHQLLGRGRMMANYVLGRQAIEQGVTPFDDDTWFVSFPRSGNTYWRFLTANLISRGKVVDWRNIERLVPDIYVTRDPELRSLPRPRYIKSHEPYKPYYRRVVMIVRDPRDVAVSCYYFVKKTDWLPSGKSIDWFVQEWMAGRVYEYGNWGENVGSWLGARRDTPDFWLFRYEDMLANPAVELTRLAQILNLPSDKDAIQLAIEHSQADRLRALEGPQRRYHKFLRRSRADVPYVRAAKSNQWQTALSPESIRAIENACGRWMTEFGYLK